MFEVRVDTQPQVLILPEVMRTGHKIIHLLAFSSGGTAFAEAGPATSGQKDRGLRVRMAPAVLGIASSAADTGTRQDHGRWAPAGGPIDRVWPQPARLRTQGWPCTKASLPVGRWRWASGNPERRHGPRNGASVAGTVHPGRLTDSPLRGDQLHGLTGLHYPQTS